jgi:hypothetical protein
MPLITHKIKIPLLSQTLLCVMFLIIGCSFTVYHFLLKWRLLWHKICFHLSCQDSDLIKQFFNLFPNQIPAHHKLNQKDFTRDRCLPFNKLVALILSMAASGTNQGIDPKAGHFFKNARRSGLWPDANTTHRSSISKARNKISWHIFNDVLTDAVNLAYHLWPDNDSQYQWNGMSVFALDGSSFQLPATDKLRAHFDPGSGLEHKGKGHYPQCLVSTVYDVFRRLPIARTVVKCDGCERQEMKNLAPFVPAHSVWLFDRGYPGFDPIDYLSHNFDGYFLFRCPAKSTFPAVERFVKTGRTEDTIWLMPSHEFKRRVTPAQRKQLKPIKIRIIRLVSYDGTVSVLLTNLFGKNKYPHSQIRDLYLRRWEVENYYRDEKVTLELEKFHSKSVNGILQELHASMIMSVICRTLMAFSSQQFFSGQKEPQFKNAILALASDIAFVAADDPQRAFLVFKELLSEMARVVYYRPKKVRPPQPRVNKGPVNKWNQSKIKLLAAVA